jgi:hypothetical protein
MPHEFLPQPATGFCDARRIGPAAGALLNILLPGLQFGVPGGGAQVR